MANQDSTATPEQLAEQFPCNTDPFGVWYNQDEESYTWAVNDENGDGISNAMHYETALIVSEALRIRHEKINNRCLLLDAGTQNEINYALLIGLESFGEIERVTDELKGFDIATTVRIPNSVRPTHPTGSNDTIGVFAAALRYMQPT